jgi:hypothetical protein
MKEIGAEPSKLPPNLVKKGSICPLLVYSLLLRNLFTDFMMIWRRGCIQNMHIAFGLGFHQRNGWGFDENKQVSCPLSHFECLYEC